MSHNLYAEISNEYIDAYYEGDRTEFPNGKYPYSKSPSIGAKIIRSSTWLPDWITDASWEKFTPNQTMMYAIAIADQASRLENMSRLDRQNELKRLCNIIGWLTYWSRQGVGIRGGP